MAHEGGGAQHKTRCESKQCVCVCLCVCLCVCVCVGGWESKIRWWDCIPTTTNLAILTSVLRVSNFSNGMNSVTVNDLSWRFGNVVFQRG